MQAGGRIDRVGGQAGVWVGRRAGARVLAGGKVGGPS